MDEKNHTTKLIISAEWGMAAFLLLSFLFPYASLDFLSLLK